MVLVSDTNLLIYLATSWSTCPDRDNGMTLENRANSDQTPTGVHV